MRADNRGEGGILALTVLALRAAGSAAQPLDAVAPGCSALALFFGDGVLTPAISVLSAVEGLEGQDPGARALCHPADLGAAGRPLLAAAPRHRPGRRAFRADHHRLVHHDRRCSGLIEIVAQPGDHEGAQPALRRRPDRRRPGARLHAARLGRAGGDRRRGALCRYGAFRARRRSAERGCASCFPALLLNYFGQGALLLADPGGDREPVFPPGARTGRSIRSSALASTATVIASQAVISGAFSLTRQAVQLGYLPRMQVRHTSEQAIGPGLRAGDQRCCSSRWSLTVLGFRSSDALGAAYGIAVTGTMTSTRSWRLPILRWASRWRVVAADAAVRRCSCLSIFRSSAPTC